MSVKHSVTVTHSHKHSAVTQITHSITHSINHSVTLQYHLFSQSISQYLSPTVGIGGGAIAGIIFCLLVVIAAVVIIAVVIFIFIGRPALKSQPPPSRRGSMRLTDSQRVTLVAAVRKNTELANLTPPDQREPIISTRFPEYVRSLHANSDHLFSEEFEVRGTQCLSFSQFCPLSLSLSINYLFLLAQFLLILISLSSCWL